MDGIDQVVVALRQDYRRDAEQHMPTLLQPTVAHGARGFRRGEHIPVFRKLIPGKHRLVKRVDLGFRIHHPGHETGGYHASCKGATLREAKPGVCFVNIP